MQDEKPRFMLPSPPSVDLPERSLQGSVPTLPVHRHAAPPYPSHPPLLFDQSPHSHVTHLCDAMGTSEPSEVTAHGELSGEVAMGRGEMRRLLSPLGKMQVSKADSFTPSQRVMYIVTCAWGTCVSGCGFVCSWWSCW